MGATTSVKTVSDALAEVERWRADQESRQSAELVEVEREVKNLENAISNLEQQLKALNKFRVELQHKAVSLPSRRLDRGHAALFGALQDQAGQLGKREALVSEAARARDEAFERELKGTSMSATVEEFRQYKVAVEPNLQSLPESYRSVVSEHHARISEQLREHVERVASAPLEVEADVLSIEVVYCVDAPEGSPELLVIVVPVTDQVHAGWRERAGGLQTWLAARVVQAIYQAAAATGFVQAQAMCGGHMDLLAVEVDLLGAPDAFVDAFEAHLGAALGASPELFAGQVFATGRRVDVDYVLPPEDAVEEPDAR